MRVSSLALAILAISSCLSVIVAQSIRGSPFSVQNENSGADEIPEQASLKGEVFTEISSHLRLLQRDRNRANRARRKWEALEKARIKRDGEDDEGKRSELDERYKKKLARWKEKFGTVPVTTKTTESPKTTELPIIQVATKPPKPTVPPKKTEPVVKTTEAPIKTELPKAAEKPRDEKSEYYESSSGVFDVKIPLFSSASALGYNGDDKQLYDDLTEATKFKVNRIIDFNIKNSYNYRQDVPMMVMTMVEAQPMAMSIEDASSPVAGDVSDYGTNTVEASIDEGDAVKTNGKVACASYGDSVVIWDAASGTYITNITLPALDPVDTNPYPYPGPWPQPQPLPVLVAEDPPELVEEVETMEAKATSSGSARPSRNGNRNRRKLLSIAYMPMKPKVESLLLHEDKLVVIASGYGQSLRSKLEYKPTLTEAFNTKIRVYDLSSLQKDTEPTLLKETNVHGRFDSIRADGSKAHLVTFSNINMYNYFDEHLSRFEPKYQGMDDEKYEEAAKALAADELIPKFVRQLMEDLTIDGKRIDVTKVCMWQRHLSGTNPKLEDTVFEGGVMQAFGQVTSFDMMDVTKDRGVKATASGVIMPTGWGHVYATDKMLVIAAQGWDWIEQWRGSVQTTYLIGFALQKSGLSAPAAVGSLQGTIIGDYSVDVVGKYMRVAVSIRNNMWRFQDSNVQADERPPTENFIRVLEIPEMDDAGTCKSGNCVLQQVGSSESFGKEGETFRGVRFSDRVAYVVTFLQTDPFYVVEFPDPTKPVMAGELEKTGFSSYLHFVNKANTLLLGVGQEADDTGRTLGVQIVLYDATDPSKPKDIQTFDYVLDKDVRAYSSVLIDPKAFRYVPLEDEKGILIMPMRLDVSGSDKGNFDGWILFDVSRNGITERFSIPHVDSADFRNRCYSSNTLEDRSFVIRGDVTTLKRHSIRQYNLDTGKPSSKGMDLDDNVVADPYMGCISC